MERKIKLSVLDQSPIRKGGNAVQALKESSRLVKFTDQLGYIRYWVSEHHNTNSVAGTAPEVLLAHLAGESKHMRLGSGGVMLPNHSALKVAENFRTLEALFPGRIDLGIGRAPGGDRTSSVLLNPSNTFSEQDFIQQLVDLKHFLTDTGERSNVKAAPIIETEPDLWLLTSSGQSGLIAAHFGMGLSFAQFINPIGGPEAVRAYKKLFKPSEQFEKPYASVAIFVMCADTEDKAMELQAIMDYQLLNMERGVRQGFPSYEEIKNVKYSRDELERITFNRGRTVSGTVEQVKLKLTSVADSYDVDEIMVATITYEFDDRLRSYELLAEAFDLSELNHTSCISDYSGATDKLNAGS
jgi:luciferase family oxidoreductase group 1